MNTSTVETMPTARDTIARLLDGAVERARRADRQLADGDTRASQLTLDSALDIVDTLREALDLDGGGNLALMLDYVYAYAALRLLEGREHCQHEPIDEAVRLLDRVASGWRDLAEAEALAA